MSEVKMTVKQLIDLDLWEDICNYKGWNRWAPNEGLMDYDEIVTFDSNFKEEFDEYALAREVIIRVRMNVDIDFWYDSNAEDFEKAFGKQMKKMQEGNLKIIKRYS